MKSIRFWIYFALLVLLVVEILIAFPKKLAEIEQAKIEEQKELQKEAKNQKLSQRQKDDKNKNSSEKDSLNDSSDEKDAGPTAAHQKLEGIQYVESQKGRRDWELTADSAEGGEGQSVWRLHHLKIIFFREDKMSFTVVGAEGSIDSKSKDISIRGDVITTSENGYIFRSPTVFYTAKSRLLSSSDQVTMRGPKDEQGEGLVVTGKGMKSLVDESRMEIESDVKAQKMVKTQDQSDSTPADMILTSSRAEFSGQNKEANFIGQVRIQYKDLQIKGDRVSFLYSSGADILSSMKVQGKVEVQDKLRRASSDQLNFDLLQNQFIFQGRPKLTQKDDVIIGDKIIFLEGGKKVKVEKINAKIEDQNKTGSK